MVQIFSLLTLFPTLALAQSNPSMTSLWLELTFLIVMLLSLKVASFSAKNKLIIFATYVLSGVVTKTLWLPVILWLLMYYIFRQQDSNQSH